MSEPPRESTDETIQALTSTILARYPGRFGEPEIEQIRKQVEQLQQAAEKLRAVPLTNADEPEPIFHAINLSSSA